MSVEEAVLFESRGRVGIITLNVEKKLNAMTQDCYYRISQILRQIEKRDDIYVTVITGKGRFFSAYATSPAPATAILC